MRGQTIGTVLYQPYDGNYPDYHGSDDSHLHFEIRNFASAANIYYDHPNCNIGDAAGRGYTYPGYPPDTYPNSSQHYTDPGTFVRSYAGTWLPLIQRANCINGQQLINNRGFEEGGIRWIEETQPYYSVITNLSLPTPAHNGTWAAWFGGRNNAVERIYQSFSVLPGTTGVNLSYYFWMRTDETSPGAYDKFRVRLRDSNDYLLQEIDYWDDNSSEYLWLSRSIIISNLSAYQGQTLRISFEGTTDSSLVTDFLLDDISFTALCGGGPTPQSPQGLTTPTSLPQATPTGFIPTKPIAPTPTTTQTPVSYP